MIRTIINLYILLIIVDTIIRYLPQYRAHRWALKIKQIVEFSCAPVRRFLPQNDLPFDFSPVVVIALLKLVEVLW